MNEQPPKYEIGQIANGHRWTGTTWEPVPPGLQAPVQSMDPVDQPHKKAWYKKPWGIGLIGLGGLLLVGAFVGGGDTTTATDEAATESTSEVASEATEGESTAAAEAKAAAAAEAEAAAAAAVAADRVDFSGWDCVALAEEAVRISRESETSSQLIKVRSVKVQKDKRDTYTMPSGDKSALVLSCKGTGVWSDGDESTSVLVRLTVDADGDAFVEYQAV